LDLKGLGLGLGFLLFLMEYCKLQQCIKKGLGLGLGFLLFLMEYCKLQQCIKKNKNDCQKYKLRVVITDMV